MAKAIANPCGLSTAQIVDIIKNRVRDKGYADRQAIMDGLKADNYTYEEAKAVTDFYFKIYNRLAENKKIKGTGTQLSHKDRLDKKVRNLAVDYLNGSTGAFAMTDADFDHLEELYKKEESAETPTLKAKYADEATVFVQKFLPSYTNELFRSFVYAKPLLSGVFWIKSFLSNFARQIERGVQNVWDGKKFDFTGFGDFYKKADDKTFKNDLANASGLNTLQGGIPAATLYQSESGFDPTRGRVEEHGIAGTAADTNKFKSNYYKFINLLSRFSNRGNASFDTRGIFHNAERHFYQLSKEFYRHDYAEQLINNIAASQNVPASEVKLSDANKQAIEDAATQQALDDMALKDEVESTKMAEAKFKELGLEAYKANGKPTNEFKVAVAEYQRLGREETRWKDAMQLAKDDFWKKNMMLPSRLGFGDYGLFGLKTQLLVRLRDHLERKFKGNKIASAFNLSAFGFLNGAANFAEDALERFAPYAAIKYAFLKSKQKDSFISNLFGLTPDQEWQFQNDVLRRQRDLVTKNITTAAFFMFARMLEKFVCGDRESKETSAQISEGRTQIGICGIPALVPPQMMATYKMYRLIENAAVNDEEFVQLALHAWPVMMQSNNIGLGGAADKIGTQSLNYAQALAKGDQVRAGEEKQKMVNTAIDYGVGVGNSFLPIPSRALSEVGVLGQRLQGQTQRQQNLPFAIDETGHRLGIWKTLGKVSVSSIGNVTGIQDMAMAAIGSNREYALDWMGRKVIQFRGSDIFGSGIKYEAADDIITTAGVKAPYVYRLTKVTDKEGKEKYRRLLGIDVTEKEDTQRYLTDNEYYNVSEALGSFNDKYFSKNEAKLTKLIQKDKEVARKFIESIFTSTKKRALEAVEKGKDTPKEILSYINQNWQSDSGMRITNKTTD